VHASENLQWDSSALGVFFTVLSTSMIITQTFILPRLSNQFDEVPLFIVGSILLAGSFGIMVVESAWLVYLSGILFGLGNGLMWPSFLALLSQLGNKKQQGAVQGVAGSAGSLASIMGLIAGGFIFSVIGQQIFMISAIGLVIIALLGVRLNVRRDTSN
ncbi:MAG: MFS transporter, partial [Saprospiraceae bacterium]|nr:MFS transporter [Saprospiraceae bacterium]